MLGDDDWTIWGPDDDFFQLDFDPEKEWLDKDDKLHQISKMETFHIYNCIMYIKLKENWRLDSLGPLEKKLAKRLPFKAAI